MKRATLSIAVLLLAATTLHAQSPTQSIAGTWQGTLTLPNNRTSRVAFSIQKNPDGALHGGITFIDSGGSNNSIPLTSVTIAASDVTITQSAAGLTYHGKLSADGQSIAGTWTQNAQALPLALSLATPDTLWKSAGPAALPPMAANADPSFDVSIIKPAQPDELHPNFDLHARKFTATGASAKELIKIAYNLRGRQVLGGPSWLEENKFDIIAEPDTPGLPSEEQTRLMVRKLLTERFHLVSHTGQQDYPVMALTLDPKGPHPTPSDPNYNLHGNIIGHAEGGDLIYQFSGCTMQQFLGLIMNLFQDKQLVDETGLTGTYDITLRLPNNLFQNSADGGVEDERGNAMIIAAQHAGFKFINKKEPLPVVIVDHIDPPTPN
jgi:uncharacterized protein (TIGR03435 family)